MRFFFLFFLFLVSNTVVGQYITTFAGSGIAGITVDNVLATNAKIKPSMGVFDLHGNYYFSQQNSHIVCKIDSVGVIHIIAGIGGIAGYNGDNILATSAKLNSPEGVVLDSLGSLYIADHMNYRIRKIDFSTGLISTIAGNGIMGDSGDNGLATLAKFLPCDIRFDKKGNLFVSDDYHNKIRKINSNGIITTYAGTGVAGFSGDNNQALLAQLSTPSGITIDKIDNLYIADVNNKRIRKVDTNGIITTIAGNGSGGLTTDNILATVAHIFPYGISIDTNFNIFLGDTLNRIRKIDSSGIIYTIAGNSIAGYNGDNILAINAELNFPGFPISDLCGNLYFGDEFNYRIRKVWFNTDTLPHSAVGIIPNDTVSSGTQVTATATVNTGTITACQWVKNGVSIGTTTSTYTYTPTNGDSLYCIVTTRACTGRTYTDTTQVLHITVTGGTGVVNTTPATTHTYPNPVQDVLYVTNTETQSYELHNLMGVAIQQGTISKNNSMDMRAIPAGIYLLQLTNPSGQREVIRVVKE